MTELFFMKKQVMKAFLFLCFIVVGVFLVSYYAAKTYVIHHAENDIRNLLLEHRGMHEYVQNIMHPALYRYKDEGEIGKSFYAPELFSSSFIVRSQHDLYNADRIQLGLPPLYYKMAALNPRNPVNMADTNESNVIRMFNDDRTKTTYQTILTIDGKDYLYVALPFLANTEACMKCHGTRNDAPVQLQKLYPGGGGFNEKVGDIRAITSIRAPLQNEYTVIFVIMSCTFAGLATVAGLFYFNFRLRGLVSERTQSLQMEVQERRHAEEEKTLSFERFKAVLDSIDALIYVADLQSYELLFINRYGRNIWGEAAGRTCWQVLQTNQSGPCPFCTNDRLLDENGESTGIYSWEFRNTLNGEWYECRDQAIQWTDKRLVRMEIATNITQRKTMHQALTEEKERLSVILRSIGDGVIATDITGRVILVNTAAETLTGWTHEDAMGCCLSEVFALIDGATRKAVKNPLDLVMSGNGVADRIHHGVLVNHNGLERSIAFKGSPITEDSGRVIGIVIAFSDISDRLRMEEELIKGKKLESIGVLAGGIAHDFNNILAVILGNVDFALTLTDSNLSDESRELLDDAVKACIRAQGLTKQLLTFAKGGEPVKEASSLTDVIRDSANFILHGDKTACRYDFPNDLWLVEIDKGQISQVVQNIILNASQAMPWGGVVDVAAQNVVSADIPELDGQPDTRYVKVSFRDRGVGIPITVIDRIFDPYFSTKQQGSGLGLAISHSIIRKHNGLISVKSTPGEGTTFTVYLPATRLDVRLSVKTLPELRPDKRVKILVMDDQEQILKMTERMLSKMGHTVVCSRDGNEAVDLYRIEFEKGEPFDFTIMDLTIPGGMGGREAVVEIHAVNPHARVLVSSGYSNDPVMANHGDYGFCGAIVKPFQLNELKQILRKLIDEG